MQQIRRVTKDYSVTLSSNKYQQFMNAFIYTMAPQHEQFAQGDRTTHEKTLVFALQHMENLLSEGPLLKDFIDEYVNSVT